MIPPPRKCACMMLGEGALRGGVERGRRLVEQPKRAAGDKQPCERDAALLPGREQRAGKSITWARPTRASAARLALARTVAAKHGRAQKARFSPAVSAPFTRPRGRDNAPVRRRCARRRRLRAQSRRLQAAESRQSARKRLDFPAPLGPSRRAPRPRSTANESPAKQRRPPRSIVKSHALRRIAPLDPRVAALF